MCSSRLQGKGLYTTRISYYMFTRVNNEAMREREKLFNQIKTSLPFAYIVTAIFFPETKRVLLAKFYVNMFITRGRDRCGLVKRFK